MRQATLHKDSLKQVAQAAAKVTSLSNGGLLRGKNYLACYACMRALYTYLGLLLLFFLLVLVLVLVVLVLVLVLVVLVLVLLVLLVLVLLAVLL